MSIYIAADYLTFSTRSRYCLKSPSASYLTTFAKIIYKHFLRAVGIEPTIPSNPHLAALAYTGNGHIQFPKVWSANTYRRSLISKVVGVPVREKAAYFFLSLLPYIYIITRILEFFKLFFVMFIEITPFRN